MTKRQILVTALVLGSIAAGVLLNVWTAHYAASRMTTPPAIPGLLWPNPRTLTPFTLTDERGQAFGLDQMSGKWSFMYFGYTHCPDACPITLALLKQFYEKLVSENTAGDVQIIFVTVDPARDTQEQMADYVRHFNEKFIGLTGTGPQITALAQQMSVVFHKADDSKDYAVDHSSAVFLVSPDRQWVGVFSPPLLVQDLLTKFTAIRKFIDGAKK